MITNNFSAKNKRKFAAKDVINEINKIESSYQRKKFSEILSFTSFIKEKKKITKKPKITKTVCLKKKKYVFVSNLSDAIREVDTSEKNKPTKNKSKINDKIGLSILFHH